MYPEGLKVMVVGGDPKFITNISTIDMAIPCGCGRLKHACYFLASRPMKLGTEVSFYHDQLLPLEGDPPKVKEVVKTLTLPKHDERTKKTPEHVA